MGSCPLTAEAAAIQFLVFSRHRHLLRILGQHSTSTEMAPSMWQKRSKLSAGKCSKFHAIDFIPFLFFDASSHLYNNLHKSVCLALISHCIDFGQRSRSGRWPLQGPRAIAYKWTFSLLFSFHRVNKSLDEGKVGRLVSMVTGGKQRMGKDDLKVMQKNPKR